MSSCPLSEEEKKKTLAEMRERRARELKAALIQEFTQRSVEAMGGGGMLSQVDIALRIDRKDILVSALRVVANNIEKGYDNLR